MGFSSRRYYTIWLIIIACLPCQSDSTHASTNFKLFERASHAPSHILNRYQTTNDNITLPYDERIAIAHIPIRLATLSYICPQQPCLAMPAGPKTPPPMTPAHASKTSPSQTQHTTTRKSTTQKPLHPISITHFHTHHKHQLHNHTPITTPPPQTSPHMTSPSNPNSPPSAASIASSNPQSTPCNTHKQACQQLRKQSPQPPPYSRYGRAY